MKSIHGLYAITVDADPRTEHKAIAALKGGCRVIQYRDKNSTKTDQLHIAHKLKQLCDEHQALLIINDDVELAKAIEADNVILLLECRIPLFCN